MRTAEQEKGFGGALRFASTLAWAIVAAAANYLIALCLAPFITKAVGVEVYGFVALASTFAGYTTIVTVALNAFTTRFITVSYQQGDKLGAVRYYSSIVVANILLALILLAAMIGATACLPYFLEIPEGHLADIQLLFVLSTVSSLITSIGTAYEAPAYIANRLDRVSFNKSVGYLADAVFLIVVYIAFPAKVFYVGIGLVLASTALLFLNRRFGRRVVPDITFSRSSVDESTVKEVLSSGLWSSINTLGNTLSTGLDLLVSGVFLSATAMGQLSITKTLSPLFSSLTQMVNRPFAPHFLRIYAEGRISELKERLEGAVVFSGFFANLVFAFFFSFSVPFYELWMPGQDSSLLAGITVVSALTLIAEGGVYPLYYIYSLTLKNKIPCFVTIAGGIFNVAAMVALLSLTDLGLYAVVWTTVVVSWATNFLFNPMYSARCLGIRFTAFYPVLARNIAACFLCTLAVFSLSHVYAVDSWMSFVFAVVFTVFICIPIHFFVAMNGAQRHALVSRLFSK